MIAWRNRSRPGVLCLALTVAALNCASAALAQVQLEVVHAFDGPGPGAPKASLVEGPDGNLYGTTAQGGGNDRGTIFRLSATGEFTILHDFGLQTGSAPQAALLVGRDGNFYGTSRDAVFKMTLEGAITVLHAFTGGQDGRWPSAPLIEARDGNFYGTTFTGGGVTVGCPYGCGTVFQMTPDGTVTILHRFSRLANTFIPGLVEADDGTFYGTLPDGGAASQGLIFQITADGVYTIVHDFRGGDMDGAYPHAPLFRATDGTFYGTTSSGGGPNGRGTVFRLAADGAVTLLHVFSGPDGASPGALTEALDGTLYGTTDSGGAFNRGTVFRMMRDGTVSTLHSFNFTDGAVLNALVQTTDGNFYGTTQYGGVSNVGLVFRMTSEGLFAVLHEFTSATEGDHPTGLVQATDGSFYGTTSDGGTLDDGTVYHMTPDGAVNFLHAFGRTEGRYPAAPLLQASDGNLYGTTRSGGSGDSGTLFRITPTGSFTLLHEFQSLDGFNPNGGLIQASDGNLYGTTSQGGAFSGEGVVFRATLEGEVTVLHRFTSPYDADLPYSGLVEAADGTFYGTSVRGGRCNCGTVYQMTPDGDVTIVHWFDGDDDGLFPRTPIIQATDRSFYGVVPEGGPFDAGGVFQIALDGATTLLHAFTGGSDGARPSGGLLQASDGNFYGTTSSGGAANAGTIFQLTPDGTFTVVHDFADNPDGRSPSGQLIQAGDGALYGTTPYGGGPGKSGVIFRFSLPR